MFWCFNGMGQDITMSGKGDSTIWFNDVTNETVIWTSKDTFRIWYDTSLYNHRIEWLDLGGHYGVAHPGYLVLRYTQKAHCRCWPKMEFIDFLDWNKNKLPARSKLLTKWP